MSGQPPDAQTLGALRDDPGPLPSEVRNQARISEEISQKIRNICFILSVTVIFNHAITYTHVWDWQGYREEPLDAGYFATVPFEIGIQHFLSGALGRITNPVFFLVSGFLFFYAWKPDRKSWERKLRRRAFTLLVPYLAWGAIGKLLNGLNLYAGKVRFLMDQSPGYSLSDILITFWNMHPPTQLWFLHDLMFMMIFAVPIILLLVRLPPAIFVPILLVAYALPWFAYVDKNALCFFTAGAYLGYRRFNPQFTSNRVRVLCILISLSLGIAYTTLAIATDWNLRLLFKAMIITGITGIWALYDFFPAAVHRYLDHFSGYRFFVYMGFDPLLPILQQPILAALPGTEASRLAVFFILPLIVAAICIGVAALLHRIAPAFYHVITGGRLPTKQQSAKGRPVG